MSGRTVWLSGIALIFVLGFARGMSLAIGASRPSAGTTQLCRAEAGCPPVAAISAKARHLVPLRPIAWHPIEEGSR